MKILKLLLALAALSTVSGETLECDYREVVYEIFDETIYACVVANHEIFNAGPISIDSVTGHHSEGESDEDVDGFELSYVTNLKKFPRDLERSFRNLLYISITATGLEELHGDDLRPFPQLKYLRLKNNWLKRIPGDLFRHTPLLEVLDMSSNHIERVAPRAFSRLRKLRVLDLAWNECRSMSTRVTIEEVRSMIRAIVNSECARGGGQAQEMRMSTMPPELSGADLGEGFALLGNFMETLANMQREMEEKMRNEKEELEKLQNQMKDLERFNGEMTTTPSTEDEQMPDLKSLSDFFAIFQGLGQAFGAMAEEEQQEQDEEEDKE